MNPQLRPTYPFDRSGVAALSELALPAFRDGLARLEGAQRDFLAAQDRFRSSDYPWPLDALHTWNRVWEYPYVWHHLAAWRKAQASPLVTVADIGSGVTFFPFEIARLGCAVACLDIDPICVGDLNRATMVFPSDPGTVQSLLTDGRSLPLADASVDAAYCISVLEHIPDPGPMVVEIQRILRPGGLLVLTVDMGLTAGDEITVPGFAALIECLETQFALVHPVTSVHPADMLHSGLGPFAWPERRLTGLAAAWFQVKQAVKPLLGRRPVPLPQPSRFAVHGWVLRKQGGNGALTAL